MLLLFLLLLLLLVVMQVNASETSVKYNSIMNMYCFTCQNQISGEQSHLFHFWCLFGCDAMTLTNLEGEKNTLY